MFISIHAPSRERRRGDPPASARMDFNPRSLAGATVILCACQRINKFQSTLPRGSDPLDSLSSLIFLTFQSTLPRGSDRALVIVLTVRQGISIHAPSRERPLIFCLNATASKFQSTLPRGSDFYGYCKSFNAQISIHAPSRERLLLLGIKE